MAPIIPTPDPGGLPAPAGLLEALLVLTFVLHLLPMNLVLGGGFVAAWAAWNGRRGTSAETLGARLRWRALAGDLARLLPVATAFTISLGIAPLLFLQVLYGQAFYTSSVLMAFSWLSLIGLMLGGYYAYYGFAFAQKRPEAGGAGWAALAALLFALVGLGFTHNMTLMLRPTAWAAIYGADEHGLSLNFGDPTLWPRYLHMLIASFAVSGLAIGILGERRAAREPEAGSFMRARGVALFRGATGLQLVSGLWFLEALPEPVRALFVGAGPAESAVLWGSVALAAAAVALAGRRLRPAAGALALTLCGMAFVRHRVREACLAPLVTTAALAVRPQWGLLALFVVLLAAGLAVIGWMAWSFATAAREER